MRIAVTSGKGGTGKTTLSTGLFYVFSTLMDKKVQILDCDVEEPDCHLFLNAEATGRREVSLAVPEIDPDKCTFCGKCKQICAFNAIVMLPPANFIEVSKDMCHACGACLWVCPENAVRETTHPVGRITSFHFHSGNDFLEGRLKPGSAMQTPVIRETLKAADKSDILVYDSPPGTSCPVVATVSRSDFVLMVTEPTPFGLHDLKLMFETVLQLGKRHGIVINKSGLKYRALYDFIEEQGIPLLGEIPFRKSLAAAYSRGELFPCLNQEMETIFLSIANKILNEKTY